MNKIFPITQSHIVKFPKKDLKGKYCVDPFITTNINSDGSVQLCPCSKWLPTVVGNIKQNTIEEILNSSLAHDIRQSIRDGTYEYCDATKCGTINNNRLLSIDEIPNNDAVDNLKSTYDRVFDPEVVEMPRQLTIAGDLICNLSCPSCRTKIISQDDEIKSNRAEIISWINQNIFSKQDPRPITIYLSLNGEVFASPLMLEFLETFPLDRYPLTEFKFQTNGLLIKKRWEKIRHLSKNIFNITISADSQDQEVYEKLRRNGKFSALKDNLEFVSQLKKELGFEFVLRMVLQKDNALEIESFYNFAMSYDVDIVEYQFLHQPPHIDNETYLELNVLNPQHPLHKKVVEDLRSLRDRYGSKVIIYHASII